MRLIGIDYGEKNIGIAISDDKAMMAFPHSVIRNDKKAIDLISSLVKSENVSKIIIGESKNYKGKDNPIMEKISIFANDLKMAMGKGTAIQIVFEPELLSSHQAAHFQGKTAMIDAAAASIILQSYIDRNKNNQG